VQARGILFYAKFYRDRHTTIAYIITTQPRKNDRCCKSWGLTPLDRSAPNLARLSRPTVWDYPPNFIRFGVFRRPWEAKTLNCTVFSNFVILWRLQPALQRQSWTHIYKHSPIQRYQDHFRTPTNSNEFQNRPLCNRNTVGCAQCCEITRYAEFSYFDRRNIVDYEAYGPIPLVWGRL